MARSFDPVVITANDLFDGHVIYLAASDTWVDQIGDAQLIVDAEIARNRVAQALALSDHAVGVVTAPARAGPAGPEPAHPREIFRAAGPSNYFHGKQADGSATNRDAAPDAQRAGN